MNRLSPASTRSNSRGKEGSTQASKFSPDFFIKAGNLILVVEIKYDEEVKDPSDENRMKHRYASEHFMRLNEELEKASETASISSIS